MSLHKWLVTKRKLPENAEDDAISEDQPGSSKMSRIEESMLCVQSDERFETPLASTSDTQVSDSHDYPECWSISQCEYFRKENSWLVLNKENLDAQFAWLLVSRA